MSGSGTWTIADGDLAAAGGSPAAAPAADALRHWRLDELLRCHGDRLRQADEAYVRRVMSLLPEREPRASGSAAWRPFEHACAAAACLALVAWHGADAGAAQWTVAALCCALLSLSALRHGGTAMPTGRLLAGLALQSLACLAVLYAAALGAGGSAAWPMIVLGAGLAALAWRRRAAWAAGVAMILLCGGACGVGNT